jgi:hypothetical protein
MRAKDYTTFFTVDQSPEQVFDAINNVASGGREKLAAPPTKLGDEFTYRYQDLHRSTQKITELVRASKLS